MLRLKCVDNRGTLIALTSLTIGNVYDGKPIGESFYEVFPCNDNGVWIFSSERFIIIDDERTILK